MKTSLRSRLLCTLLVGATAARLPAATPAAEPATATTLLDQHTLDKRTAPILKDLKLGDAAKENTVRGILETHFQALQAWHAKNDAQLKTLWADWAAARTTASKDESKAAAVGDKIDQVYATFRPQHDAFLAQLATVLSPQQIETVKDSFTKSPGLQRTYQAYLQIVPALTDAQKTFIRQKLEVAREQAMDAISNKEKADFFKRQKVKVEAFIDDQGYDWKKSYAAFVAKQKAATEPAPQR